MGGTLLQVSHSWHTRSPSAIGYYHSFGLSCCAHTERDYTPPKRSQGKRIINIPPKEEEEEEKKTHSKKALTRSRIEEKKVLDAGVDL